MNIDVLIILKKKYYIILTVNQSSLFYKEATNYSSVSVLKTIHKCDLHCLW